MDLWLMKALTKLIRKRYALFKVLIIGVLVLNLTACGGKAVSQDISIQLADKPVGEENAQLSRKISEVAPPEVIQELRQSLENYQPQIQILNPKPDEVLQEDKLTVGLQVKDLPIFKDARYGSGSHLDVILDNEAEVLEIYDLDKPLELSDLSPGTHTLRVFASRAWNESFKNEGAYAQTTFHVFTKSDDNNPTENLPILTYNSPQGSYGAEPILLDFYLTNAPLHILAKDNPDNPIADWRIRCTINGESFIIDRWQSLYLKGFNEGKNWVKLEFLDNQGNPVKNVYNSTVKVINYEPQGKDTLAKIVRGELSAEDLRGIVDTDYAVETLIEATPETQLEEKSEKGGFFDRFKRGKEDKTSTPQPNLETTPEVIETPKSETELEETIPEVIETPQPETELEETIPEIIETPQPETELEETIPEIIETPQPEAELEETIPEVIETPQPEAELEETIPEVIETPQPETTLKENLESTSASVKSKINGLINKFKRGKSDKTSTPQPTLETTPEIIETPQPETELEETIPEVIETPKSEIKLEETIPEVIETPTPESTPESPLGEYFKLPRGVNPVATPEVEVPQNVPVIEQQNVELIEK
ncbi:MAG: hypothetical protein AAFV71_13510 [Cyanobacteria bacterium J06633_8]